MNREKILFLDFDGVLNSIEFAKRTEALGILGLDSTAVAHVQKVIDATDCAIVVSSTWRIGRTCADLRGILIKAGMRRPCPVIDRTESEWSSGTVRHIRGDEIRAAVYKHAPLKYVCLDDDDDFHPDQPLVQTNVQIGMTAEDAYRCIQILGSTVKPEGKQP